MEDLKKCLCCGKEMKLGFRRGDAKFCDSICRNKYYQMHKGEARYCEVCGRKIVGRQRTYCGEECREKMHKVQMAEWRDMHTKPVSVKNIVKKPNIQTAEINAAARVKGMSYGQFTARYITAPTADVNITKHKKWAVFNLGEGEVIATTGRETVVGNYKEIQLHIARKTGKKKEEVVI